MIYDDKTKTVVSTGTEYTYSYSRCAQFVSGAKGVSHCSKYVPASEKRVPVIFSHFGGLYETSEYLVKYVLAFIQDGVIIDSTQRC